MPFTENSAGTMSHTAALVRGTATQRCFRDVISPGTDLGGTTDWRFRAVTAVLGQLAVVDPSACDKVVEGASAAGRTVRSIAGIEGVLLSALLGSTGSARVADAVAEVWDHPGVSRTRDGSATPVLDPATGELVSLSTADLADLPGLDLRARVRALCAGGTDHRTGEEVATAVLTSATAVATLTRVAALPADHRLRSDALRLLGGRPGAIGLPRQIAAGTATPVDLVPPGSAGEHPVWLKAPLCAGAPVAGPGLAGQVVRRGNTLLLQALPRVDASGDLVSRGFLPDLAPEGDREVPAGPARGGTPEVPAGPARGGDPKAPAGPPRGGGLEVPAGPPRGGTPEVPAGPAKDHRRQGPVPGGEPDTGGIDSRPLKIIHDGPEPHPLIPVLVDPITGQVVGTIPGPGHITALLRDALRAPDLGPGSTVEEVLDRVVQVRCGLRTLWRG